MTSLVRAATARAAVAVAAAVLVSACGGEDVDPTSAQALANSTYLTDATPDGVITLMGGRVDLPPGGDVRRMEMFAFHTGDLNGDEFEDAAVIIVEFTAMEQHVRLHALFADEDDVEDVASRLIGDNVSVEALRIVDGLIELDLLVRRPRENRQTPPTVPITSTFAVTDRGLIPVSEPTVAEGAPTMLGAGQEATLVSHEWILTTIEMGDWSQTTDELQERPALRFAVELGEANAGNGSVSGFSGCNRFFGSYRAGADGSLSFGALGSTRRLCGEPFDDLEQRVLASVAASRSFTVEDDRLVIEFDGGVMQLTAGATLIPPGSDEPDPAPSADEGESADREA